ncbi:hypothetical protein [Chitinophaga flava]|uniref:Uncharacterized protein n=1 Tax=Chitinophaga flava TaxID=2259036 RepID=A0A365Y615_9BACT|nr:hypothetical protein [Chitinophaga flava]RBL93335.1 hypothetical protein DF182_12480 [Chitinophaga flava]
MVTVKSYFFNQSADGNPYICLELIGELEMLISEKSGKFYADVKKCKIPTRIDEATAKLIVGREIPGSIVKKECAAWEYTIPATGEVITMHHRYEYER